MTTKEYAAFEMLDLAPIKMKLMHVESGEGWSAVRADAAAMEYRRFLFLMKKHPDANATPTVDVDTFWHYHILDTLKYARDCEALFGYFLHHYPYVGIGASANDGDHAVAGERMRAIYEAAFGAGPAASVAHAFCSSPGTPRAGANTAYAFNASPGKPGEAAYAFCSSPGGPVEAAYAFCSAPGKPGEAAYAFCSSPGKPREAHAFCSSPAQPRKATDAVYAFCSSPGKQMEHAA